MREEYQIQECSQRSCHLSSGLQQKRVAGPALTEVSSAQAQVISFGSEQGDFRGGVRDP